LCARAENLSPSLGALNPTAVAFNMHKSGNEASSLGISEDRTDCLRAFEKSPFAVQPSNGMMVRRLTPEECEKLQGFLPGYTNVPHRNKPAADGPRYKALGNSWAVPCARWIGERIEAVEALSRTEQREAA
jgi:DNA (cytosine-5)-methyltransferase 1